MKTFNIYPRQERDLRQLLEKLKNYGQCNCDFATFSAIYNEWHKKTFPGTDVDTRTAIFRDDWFTSFVNYMANRYI